MNGAECLLKMLVDYGVDVVFGLPGDTGIETADELEAALADAFSLHEPCFLDVAVESIADRLPPVFSWLTKVGADSETNGAGFGFGGRVGTERT